MTRLVVVVVVVPGQRHGAAASTIEGTHKADWPSIKALAKLHDDMEFEAIVPVARWRGFGGETNFAGPGFETYTFAAGVGAQTTYPAAVATSHVPLVHPIMAAKQMLTIDHITGVVCAKDLLLALHVRQGAPPLVAGFATLYSMYGWPDRTRLRVCQVAALPPVVHPTIRGRPRQAQAVHGAAQLSTNHRSNCQSTTGWQSTH